MKTIYVVHCCNAIDSAWLDMGQAQARAKEVDMIALPCPMLEDGDPPLPTMPRVYCGRPPGYNGGPPGRDVDR